MYYTIIFPREYIEYILSFFYHFIVIQVSAHLFTRIENVYVINSKKKKTLKINDISGSVDNKLIPRCTISIPIKDSSNDRTGVTSKTYPIQTDIYSRPLCAQCDSASEIDSFDFRPGR